MACGQTSPISLLHTETDVCISYNAVSNSIAHFADKLEIGVKQDLGNIARPVKRADMMM